MFIKFKIKMIYKTHSYIVIQVLCLHKEVKYSYYYFMLSVRFALLFPFCMSVSVTSGHKS